MPPPEPGDAVCEGPHYLPQPHIPPLFLFLRPVGNKRPKSRAGEGLGERLFLYFATNPSPSSPEEGSFGCLPGGGELRGVGEKFANGSFIQGLA